MDSVGDVGLFSHYLNLALQKQQQPGGSAGTSSLNSALHGLELLADPTLATGAGSNANSSYTSKYSLMGALNSAGNSSGVVAGGGTPNANASASNEDYCELCQKQFCNKYYLKKHKLDVHGVTSDAITSATSTPPPATVAALVSASQQSNLVKSNLINGKQCAPSPQLNGVNLVNQHKLLATTNAASPTTTSISSPTTSSSVNNKNGNLSKKRLKATKYFLNIFFY